MKLWLDNFWKALVAVFTPAAPVFFAVFVLVVVDLITALIAAWKNSEPLVSAGIRRSVSKLLIYLTACGAAWIAQLYLTGPDLPCLRIASTLIAVAELKSIFENLDKISGGTLLQSIIDKLSNTNKS